MATVPAGALRQRASRVRSRSRSSSDVEPSQFSSVNVREAFTEASWPSSWAISLSGHGTAPSWRLGVYDLEVISAHIVDLETAQLLYPGTSEHAKADQVGQRGVLAFLRKLQQLSYLRGRESLPDRACRWTPSPIAVGAATTRPSSIPTIRRPAIRPIAEVAERDLEAARRIRRGP